MTLEPVAYVDGYYGGHCVVRPIDTSRLFNSGTPFYTEPPKSEWVGLTDKRILEIWTEQWNLHSKDYAENHIYYFGKAIEAALRNQNT